MGGNGLPSTSTTATAQDPSGNCAVPSPVQAPAGDCAVRPAHACSGADQAASLQQQHAEEQQRAAQAFEQQLQALRATQLQQQQTLLDQQNYQLHQQLLQTAPGTPVDVLPALSPTSQTTVDDQAVRAELLQTATLLGTGLAADSVAITEARSALRGRLSQAAQYGPNWLQDGIDMFNRAHQQEADVSTQYTVPTEQLLGMAQGGQDTAVDAVSEQLFDPCAPEAMR